MAVLSVTEACVIDTTRHHLMPGLYAVATTCSCLSEAENGTGSDNQNMHAAWLCTKLNAYEFGMHE